MQHNQKQSLKGRFEQYQPSKTALLWACAGSVVAATVIGFTWGGWVTGGSASDMAERAGAEGRQEVAAVVCVDRFMAAPDAGAQLAALKEISSSYQRDKFVEAGGWATMGGDDASSTSRSRDDREAAELCAEALLEREIPVAGEAELIKGEATVAQKADPGPATDRRARPCPCGSPIRGGFLSVPVAPPDGRAPVSGAGSPARHR